MLREEEAAADDDDGDEDVENIPDWELNVLLLLLLLEDVKDDDEEYDSLGKFRMGTIGNDI